MKAKAQFGWFIARTVLGSLNPWSGSLTGIKNNFPEKDRLIRRALHRTRILGRRVLFIIARYQKSFMDQSFLLGDEGGVFDQLCFSTASLVYAISLEKKNAETIFRARERSFQVLIISNWIVTKPKRDATPLKRF